MEKFMYAVGLGAKGLLEYWDNFANWLLLGFNQVPLETIFTDDDMMDEEMDQDQHD